MKFEKYQHIERWGTQETEGIADGRCYIFYKIDGTNGSVWMNTDGLVHAGSRNRELSEEEDNAGFYKEIKQNTGVAGYLTSHPNHRLYGEWLVPHSVKTYRADAWRKFYIFDVCSYDEEGNMRYLSYDEYKPLLEEFGLEYIPPMAFIDNPTDAALVKLLDKTGEFLVKDGEGNGEGIVIKNYDYKNKYGRQTWAKIVCNEFKEQHKKSMGVPQIKSEEPVEGKIVNDLCTEAFIEKEYAKIVSEKDGWNSQYIPMLLGRVYYEFVCEETYNAIKKYKNPTIDFSLLQKLLTQRVKSIKSDLF